MEVSPTGGRTGFDWLCFGLSIGICFPIYLHPYAFGHLTVIDRQIIIEFSAFGRVVLLFDCVASAEYCKKLLTAMM